MPGEEIGTNTSNILDLGLGKLNISYLSLPLKTRGCGGLTGAIFMLKWTLDRCIKAQCKGSLL